MVERSFGGGCRRLDWIGINLARRGALMAFRIRGRTAARSGRRSLAPRDGRVRALRPGGALCSSAPTGVRRAAVPAYPVAMRVEAGSPALDLEPLIDDQEPIRVPAPAAIYWEGAVRARQGDKALGRDNLELTATGNRSGSDSRRGACVVAPPLNCAQVHSREPLLFAQPEISFVTVRGRRLEVGRVARRAGNHAGVPPRRPGVAVDWRDFPQQAAAATGCAAVVFSTLRLRKIRRAARAAHGRLHARRRARVLPSSSSSRRDRPILVGHSDGGSIALIHAAGRDDVRGLVVMAAHVFRRGPEHREHRRGEAWFETPTDLPQKLARHNADAGATFRGWNDSWLHPDFRLEIEATAAHPLPDSRHPGFRRRVRDHGPAGSDRRPGGRDGRASGLAIAAIRRTATSRRSCSRR